MKKSYVGYRFLLDVLILVLAVFIIILFLQKSSPSNNSDVPLYKKDVCANTLLLVNVNKVTFEIPRHSIGQIILRDGENISSPKRKSRYLSCDAKEVSAQEILLHSMIIQDIKLLRSPELMMGTYRFHKDDVYRALKYEEFDSKLQNGTLSFRRGGEDIYVLPKEEAHTFDGNPVVIRCGINTHNSDGEVSKTNSCNVVFSHPDGLLVHYRFLTKNNKPDEYLHVHKRKLELLESLKKKP